MSSNFGPGFIFGGLIDGNLEVTGPTTLDSTLEVKGIGTFDSNLNVTGSVMAAQFVPTNPLPVSSGGSGVATLGSGNFLVGNGTSPIMSTLSVPSGSIVGTTATQTLSNKTLLSPVVTGGSADNIVIGGGTPAAGTFTTLSTGSLTTTGGTINRTVIGGVTPAAGTFTNLTADGTISMTSTSPVMIIANGSNDALTWTNGSVTLGDLGYTGADTNGYLGLYVDGSTSPSNGAIILRANGASDFGNPTNIFSGAVTVSGTLTASDLNATYGTIDDCVIGSTTPAAATITELKVTTGGGYIENTTIGDTTAAAGTFTNLTANGGVNLNTSGSGATQIGNHSGGNLNLESSTYINLYSQSVGMGTPSSNTIQIASAGWVGATNPQTIEIGNGNASSAVTIAAATTISTPTPMTLLTTNSANDNLYWGNSSYTLGDLGNTSSGSAGYLGLYYQGSASPSNGAIILRANGACQFGNTSTNFTNTPSFQSNNAVGSVIGSASVCPKMYPGTIKCGGTYGSPVTINISGAGFTAAPTIVITSAGNPSGDGNAIWNVISATSTSASVEQSVPSVTVNGNYIAFGV